MFFSKFVISAFFLDSVKAYPLPSGSGPGITVTPANSQDLQNLQASFTCTTSEGVVYSDGSMIINTNIHQQAVCVGPNNWSRSVYPTNCNIRDQNTCWNSCAHNFSGECSWYCACVNQLGASGPSSNGLRLGASEGGDPFNDDHQPDFPFNENNVKLGHSGNPVGVTSCPWWLPQAIGQLSPGAIGFTCYTNGQLCKYPSAGKNFLCQHGVWHLETGPPPPPTQCPTWFQIWSGAWCPTNGVLCNYPQHFENFMCNNGRWQLQSGPRPPVPSPTPPPTGCPSWGNIWNGDYCPTNGVMCNYPRYFENFMCTNGRWQLQSAPGPPIPAPTPAPVNPVSCPVQSFPPSNNGFCSVNKLLCKYPSGNFRCDNGRWRKLYL